MIKIYGLLSLIFLSSLSISFYPFFTICISFIILFMIKISKSKRNNDEIFKFWSSQVLGHRGCRYLKLPENSLEALCYCLDHGCTGFELDIRTTKDNELVVFHDDHINRCLSSNSNKLIYVEQLTLAQLKQYQYKDIDHKNKPETSITFSKHEQTTIPTIEDVFKFIELYQTYHPKIKIRLFIETKGTLSLSHFVQLSNLFDKYPFLYKQSVVGSFNPKHILYTYVVNQNIYRGLIYRDNNLHHKYIANDMNNTIIPSYLLKYRFITYIFDRYIFHYGVYYILANFLDCSMISIYAANLSKIRVIQHQQRNLFTTTWGMDTHDERKAYVNQWNVAFICDSAFPKLDK